MRIWPLQLGIAMLVLAPASVLFAQSQTTTDTSATTAVNGDASDPAADLQATIETARAAAAAAAEVVAEALPTSSEAAALAEIESTISLSKERVAALKQEIDALQGDRARQSAELIAAGERVKLAESDIAGMEARLGDLIVAELEVRGRLESAGSTISGVLAALERISRHPPPALIVDPADALGSARSAILIAAIVPQLQKKADELMADLRELGEIKNAALEEEERLRANFEILEEEQLRIATLITARKVNETRATAELSAEEAEIAALAAKAADLKQLVDELARRAQAVALAGQATAAANAGGTAPRLDAETIRMALANADRSQPAIPFEQARGYLTLPSSGVSVVEYGNSDGFGGISDGISIVTRAEATVVAPADGWVLYKGDYLNYGQIVILNVGQDFTILLAGMADVSVDIGQFVLMGEPLGAMGTRTIGQTVTTNAGVSRPTLYIEMRRHSEPLDPTGWWAQTQNTTQSG